MEITTFLGQKLVKIRYPNTDEVFTIAPDHDKTVDAQFQFLQEKTEFVGIRPKTIVVLNEEHRLPNLVFRT